ncbi:hypothetical protein ID866_1215 [Astraeus odoratus]|nr:hypothetical protein ID866_1215 [Astraeus odoratus]
MRSFQVYQVISNAPEQLEIYRFQHPTAGYTTPTTTYRRKNLNALMWENAGRIEWSSSTNATVWFGVDEVPLKELRKVKNSTSQSRRFKAVKEEYKWKIAENGNDLFCIDSKNKHVAAWSAEEKVLRVAPRYVTIIERIMITCFLNSWFKQLGRW